MGPSPALDSSDTGVHSPSDTDKWNQFKLISPLTSTGAQMISNISTLWEVNVANFTVKETLERCHAYIMIVII